MDRLSRDFRFALRGFRRTPAFAVATTAILGIGIGMAAATVTVYDAVLLRKLPVTAQDRVVLPRVIDRVGVAIDLMPPQIAQLRRGTHTMIGIAGVTHAGANDSPLNDGDRSLVLRWVGVTGNFFAVLGARPLLGRFFNPTEGDIGSTNTLILSYGAWKRHFHGDSSVIGRSLTSPYYTAPFTVIGVAPPGLDYPSGVEVWVSTTPDRAGMMNIVARLAPDANPETAGAELLDFMRHTDGVAATYVESATSRATTLPQAIVGDVRPALRMLTAAVGLLLLIVCVNIGNLLLSRAASRSRELAVRRALGASATDIARQLLVESALIAVVGGVLGYLCADELLRVVIATAPQELPRLDAITLGLLPLAWCLATTLLTLLIFGAVPAFIATRGDLATPLRFDARSGREGRAHRRFRQALVASQVALALIVLAGGGLLLRSFLNLERIRIGYQPDHLSFLWVSIDFKRFESQPKINDVYDEIDRQLHAVPGVAAVTPVLVPPYVAPDLFLLKVATESGAAADRAEHPLLPVSIGGPELFRVLGTSIVRGRGFTSAEAVEHAPRVAVISEGTARLLWPGEDPIGKRLRSAFDSSATAWTTVVGVVGDLRYRRLKEAQPTIYLPWRAWYYWSGNVAIRTSRPVATMQRELERAVTAANPNIHLWSVHPASDYLDTMLAQPRLTSVLLSALAAVATLLAAIGLYAIMTAAVREQTREIGVRMALGATPERVRYDVLRTALRVTGVGAAAGLALALVGTRLLSSLLFEVRPIDPLSLGIACGVLAATAIAAAYMPARRATRIDPIEALRAD